MLSYLLAALESEEDKRRFTELYEENHVRAEHTADFRESNTAVNNILNNKHIIIFNVYCKVLYYTYIARRNCTVIIA